MEKKLKSRISIGEAVENLSAASEISPEFSQPIGLSSTRIFLNPEDFTTDTSIWVREEGKEPILEVLDQSYQIVRKHLVKISEDPDTNWDNEKMQAGLSSMMDLASKAAAHMGRTFEFELLASTYGELIAPHFAPEKAAKEGMEIVFENAKMVLADTDYEFFFIRNEAGLPYYSSELLRELRIGSNGSADFEEDPLLKVRAVIDRDLHTAASFILRQSYPMICEFFKVLHSLAENELAQALSKGVIALFLAANPRHLIQNTEGKSCLQYFDDFQRFLRQAMRTDEYQKILAYPSDRGATDQLLNFLTHSLCRSLFFRPTGVRLESIGLIHRIMRKSDEDKQAKSKKMLKAEGVWNTLSLDDEKFRSFLSQFPNGPVFKILDGVREENPVAYDPLGQGNLPFLLFEFPWAEKKIECLHLPCPTIQAIISKVEVSDEFRGLLRALAYKKTTHLFINLQDRTSWKEYTRSKCVETLASHAEFSKQLFTMTLPKHTDFYYQIAEYEHLSAEQFLQTFLEHLKNPEEHGFFFPAPLKEKILPFAQHFLPAIHELFFKEEAQLSREQREIFVEIFYQVLVLKALSVLRPDSISFTCKDALDTGACSSALFYGFLKLLEGALKEKAELDFLRWLLYAPALFVRERPVHSERFQRVLACLEWVDEQMSQNDKKILKMIRDSL